LKINCLTKKLNIFDIFIILSLLLIALTFVLAKNSPKNLERGRPILVTVKVPEDTAEIIFKEASKLEEVNISTIKNKVKTFKVDKITDENGKIVNLYITLLGKGEITQDRFVFNGIRILIGQKVDIHGKYHALGIVSDVKYAD